MTAQETTPFTALSLVPEVDGPESVITCFESWGMFFNIDLFNFFKYWSFPMRF